ncbi:MAG TPA: Fur family transcriptional regulator [Tepidiformaceae bacterium]|nr:Fur family transcriptional regulator [Tepidiformaceae bacterium]
MTDTQQPPRDAELVARLQAAGYRLTPQRLALVHLLSRDDSHPSAEQIYARLRAEYPTVSLATVYNTLNELVGMGEIREIATGDGPRRYDPNTTSAHHHLYCVGCGALRDVHPTGDDTLALGPAEQHGFHLLGLDIVFRGICPDCSTDVPGAAVNTR